MLSDFGNIARIDFPIKEPALGVAQSSNVPPAYLLPGIRGNNHGLSKGSGNVETATLSCFKMPGDTSRPAPQLAVQYQNPQNPGGPAGDPGRWENTNAIHREPLVGPPFSVGRPFWVPIWSPRAMELDEIALSIQSHSGAEIPRDSFHGTPGAMIRAALHESNENGEPFLREQDLSNNDEYPINWDAGPGNKYRWWWINNAEDSGFWANVHTYNQSYNEHDGIYGAYWSGHFSITTDTPKPAGSYDEDSPYAATHTAVLNDGISIHGEGLHLKAGITWLRLHLCLPPYASGGSVSSHRHQSLTLRTVGTHIPLISISETPSAEIVVLPWVGIVAKEGSATTSTDYNGLTLEDGINFNDMEDLINPPESPTEDSPIPGDEDFDFDFGM